MIQTRLNRIKKEIDWIKSKFEKNDQVEILCMTLGPQRNLTTLTAALMALHPNVQVLNHAGPRVLSDARLDFFEDGKPLTYQNFIKFAIHISKGGKRGAYGGSIRHAHSFDKQYPVHQKYHRRFGDAFVKNELKLLFWKDSMRLGEHLRKPGVNLGNLLDQFNQLRFVMPVRFPLDVMRSTREKGYHRLYPALRADSTEEEVLEAVLLEMQWFCRLKKQFPDFFFCFFEHQFNRQTMIDMAHFLELELDKQWLEDCLQIFKVRRPYEHPRPIQDYFQKQVETLFADFPDFQSGLYQFIKI